MTVVGFDRVAHLIRVPVRLGGDELHFLGEGLCVGGCRAVGFPG